MKTRIKNRYALCGLMSGLRRLNQPQGISRAVLTLLGLIVLVAGIARADAAPPLPVAGAKLWLRADAITGKADGDPVSVWTDLSGNGNDLSQPDAARQPTFHMGVFNGGPVLRFDGLDDGLFRAVGLSGMTSLHTTFVVMRHTSFGTYYPVLWNYVGNLYVHAPYGENNYKSSFYSTRGDNRPDPGIATGQFYTMTWTENGTSATLHTDGVLRATYTGGLAPALAGRRFELANYSGGFTIHGDFAQVIIYNRVLSGTERQAVEQFLNSPPIQAPVANAGPDQRVNELASVSLDGTGSHDMNTPLLPVSYTWTQLSGPAVTLANANTATPTFTAPLVNPAGALVFQLTVSNGATTPATDTVNVNIDNVNMVPTANAGPGQTLGENTLVTLDAYGSSDPDFGDILTAHWSQVSGFGPMVVLTDADTFTPTFTAPDVTHEQGTVVLKFQLIVNDGQLDSGPSIVSISVININDAPIANAGPDQMVNELDLVTLDGTLSSDPDSNPLTYSWTQIPASGSPTVTLTGANTATPSFQAPVLMVGGQHYSQILSFQLTVNDGTVSSTSTANVRVSNVNHPPVADAGPDQTVPSATLVTLDGSNSADVDGDALTYSWVQTTGPSVAIINPNAPTPAAPGPGGPGGSAGPGGPGGSAGPPAPSSSSTGTILTFTAPVTGPEGAVLTFDLTVADGYGGVTSDEVVVNVTYVNHPPTASAGAPQTVNEGDTAFLTGTASDPDDNPLTTAWTQVSGPTVTLANADSLAPSFTAPLVTRAETDIVLRLTVNDGYGGITTSDVSIHIANLNHAPIAQAPANMSVPEVSLVTLIGQGTDPDTEEQSQLVYAWQQTIGPAVQLSGVGANISFTAPPVTANGDPNAKTTLTFVLTVTDPNGVTGSSSVDVVVANVDHAPTAIAGGNLIVNEGASVTLNGSASSDPDLDPLTYAWVQVSGVAVSLHDANTAYPYFIAPFVNAAGATLQFKLTVNDPYAGTSCATMAVTVNNINDPPNCDHAQASIVNLWPPDHRMVKVSITGVVDPSNNAQITITSVTQNELTCDGDDHNSGPDAVINADGTVLLRAERSGDGTGRVYHVHFTAADFEGFCSNVVTVSVPHDKKGDKVKDGGERFDSEKAYDHHVKH